MGRVTAGNACGGYVVWLSCRCDYEEVFVLSVE